MAGDHSHQLIRMTDLPSAFLCHDDPSLKLASTRKPLAFKGFPVRVNCPRVVFRTRKTLGNVMGLLGPSPPVTPVSHCPSPLPCFLALHRIFPLTPFLIVPPRRQWNRRPMSGLWYCNAMYPRLSREKHRREEHIRGG